MPTPGRTVRARAVTTYRAGSYPRTSVPRTAERHLMDRMGCGWSRTTTAELRAAGGVDAWFERQLSPTTVADTLTADRLLSWYPRLDDSAASKYAAAQAGGLMGWEHARDLGTWTALRRVYSRHQVHETLVDFWSNHLHIPLNADKSWLHRFDYDRTIRRYALGRFEDLLVACSLHPAMLIFLDNFKSVRNAPNENQGRELLELHTVGRTSGYTEDMVKASARILSGWTVDYDGTWQAYYDPARHTTGPVQVLGFTDPNASSDGQDLCVRYLKYLANHPATARTIAHRLAVRFVSDTPSDDLVNLLAQTYLDHGTDIAATLRVLVGSDEFKASVGQKVRTPIDDMVATMRVLGVQVVRPTSLASFAHEMAWLPRSMLLYQWPRPDGAPETNAEWASAARMLNSFRMHWMLSGGYYPSKGATYRRPASWLPQPRIRVDRYVDHLCRVLLGRASTTVELRAVCQATGRGPLEYVTRTHPLAGYLFVRMATALLDTPDHMTR